MEFLRLVTNSSQNGWSKMIHICDSSSQTIANANAKNSWSQVTHHDPASSYSDTDIHISRMQTASSFSASYDEL